MASHVEVDARKKGIEECIALCQRAATYYDLGAGKGHSDEARGVGKAQCEWLEGEFRRMLEAR